MKKGILAVIAVCLMVTSAEATISLENYTAAKRQGGTRWLVTMAYLSGVAEGFGWANSVLRQNHQKPLYCPPENLPINNENIVSILDHMIATNPKPPKSATADMMLILGLQDTFPCKQ